MLKTNQSKLIMQAVQGKIAPGVEWYPFEISHEGKLFTVPSTGSITYNVKVGDSAFGWAGDHRTGFSEHPVHDDKYAQRGYNFLS